MTTEELLEHISHHIGRCVAKEPGAYAQACEFLRVYAGPDSDFYQEAKRYKGIGEEHYAARTLEGFRDYVNRGLLQALSPEQRARLDVISDILGQAHDLLEDKTVHAAAPTVLIGASLEEFLREWVERDGLSIGSAKPGIDAYAKALRTADKINKQDIKDITAWAGRRNDAAHGDWDAVSDRDSIRNMLEGVNLFMRKYTP